MGSLLPYDQAMGSYPSLYSIFVHPATTKVEFTGFFAFLYVALVISGAVSSFAFLALSKNVPWMAYTWLVGGYFVPAIPLVLTWHSGGGLLGSSLL